MSAETVLDILGFYFYRRCFWDEHTLELGSFNASLVENAFGRMKIIKNEAVTVVDEPFVFQSNPGLHAELKNLIDRSDATTKGNLFERYMMTVFSETFKARRLSEWPHQPSIMDMCPAFDGMVEIVGWREPGLLQGMTHVMMSMEEFMDAHVNHHSVRNNKPVAPFFFPRHKPSGPDMVFFIRIDSTRVIPVFVQDYFSYERRCISVLPASQRNCGMQFWIQFQRHVSRTMPRISGTFCPDNIYISMVAAYPITCSPDLPPVQVPKPDANGVQQVVTRVEDSNFGKIFPKDHVMFIDRLKRAGKRTAGDIDSYDEDRSKKAKTDF
ncbi:hypothetical protein BGZ73_008381 [Actinomortierella ambigua]|nr:hypothetical protein BGZ73_008381 [Actinomortierella ambigua]